MNAESLRATLASRYAEARLQWQLWHIKRKCPLTKAALATMPADQFLYGLNISPRYRYVYVDNPKTGCSSLKSALVELETRDRQSEVDCYDDAVFADPFVSPLSSLLDFGPDATLSHLIANGYRFITMVRNPYTRLVSAYRDKMLGDSKEKAKIIESMRSSDRTLEQSVSFRDFVNVIISQNDADMDPHWRVQARQILFDIIPYAFIGRFETYQQSVTSIFATLGIPSRIDSAPQTSEPFQPRGGFLQTMV